ncbi:MAG: response regulator [Chitinophagaceae bacterium]|nr:response regulator [Chitinophagaceae bacterium]
MKTMTAFLRTLIPGISKPIFISFLIVFALFAVIILNYFAEERIHNSVKDHNNSTEQVVRHEKFKQVIDKTGFTISQMDYELNNYLLTSAADKLKILNEQMNQMRENAAAIKNEASAYVPKYLVNIYTHKLRNRIDFQNHVLNLFHQQGKKEALSLMNSSEQRDTYSEFSKSETELTAALNKKITTLNSQLLNDEDEIISLDSRWNVISLVFMLVIATVVFYQTIRIGKLNGKLGIAVLQMKHAQEVKDQFMSNITHELRTPLNSILGYTNLLLKRRHTPETESWIQAVNTSGNLLLEIVNDVLDYSKLESGYLQVYKSSFQMDDVLSSVKKIMTNRADAKKLSFVILKDQSLPLSFLGDEKKLKQILVNLTGNAIKFTDSGTVKIEVLLHKHIGNQYWLQFAVSDTGIGISAENLPHIFERFYQAENGFTKKYSGTGLGLPIVKQMIDLQGGSITVKSLPAAGASFTFVLPFEKIEHSAAVDNMNLAPVHTMLQASSKRILVVDDHELNRELLVLLLNEYNCRVETADNGAQAISKLLNRKFDLVLMDVQMPEMNGIETTLRIRNELVLDVPVIACTAFNQPAEKEACTAAGMNDYLGKPIQEEELLQVLNKHLQLNMPATDENPVVNFHNIHKVTGNNKELTNSVISRAVDFIPGEIEALHEAILKQDEQLIKELAHNMCSSVALMGAPDELVEILKTIQYKTFTQENDYSETLQQFYRVNHAVRKMITELRNYLAA